MSTLWVIAFFALVLFALYRSFARPGVSLGLLICMFGLENFLQSQSSLFVERGSLVNLSVGSVVLIIAVHTFSKNRTSQAPTNSIQILSISLYALGYLSYYWTLSPEIQANRWFSAFPYFITYLLLAPYLLKQPAALGDALKTTAWIGVPLLLLVAFYCEWGTRGILLAAPIVSESGVVTEAFPLAIASLASIVGIIVLAIDFRVKNALLIRVTVFALCLYTAFLTHSRGQVLVLAVGAVAVYTSTNRVLTTRGLLALVVGVVGIVFVVYFLASSVDLWRWEQGLVEKALAGRRDMSIYEINKWLEGSMFVLVLGFGACASFDLIGGYPHNLAVEILVELGCVGILIYLWIIGTTCKSAVRLMKWKNDSESERRLSLAICSVFAVNLALSFKEGSFDGWQALFFFAICIAQRTMSYELRADISTAGSGKWRA